MGESTAATRSGHVASRDGTRIAFWRSAQGLPLVLVHGATADHASFRFLAPELESDFTVCAVDRRGRRSHARGDLRGSPVWPVRVAAAHTIARELRAEEAYRLDGGRFAAFTAPTLLLLGEESPDWAREGVERIRAMLPHAEVAVLRGQAHVAILTAPELVAAELTSFLSA